MFNQATVINTILVYVALQFILALWVERSASLRKNIISSPWVYALSLGVYCTAWTYYGSVGKAASSGMLFLTIYLGPTLSIVFWWVVLRKLVRIKNLYHTTSIADFISARYNRSQGLAAIATAVALIGLLPYIALQLKAIFSTFQIISSAGSVNPYIPVNAMIVAIMVIFSILLGIRHLDPTERHPGMIAVLAVQCVVKLVAFLAVGIFVVFFLFHGFGDIFARLPKGGFLSATVFSGNKEAIPYLTWFTYLVLAMSAIMFLPRQFHVSVVENSNEKHIRTAMWFFPVYMFLLNIFVYPIAIGGLRLGHSVQEADNFVLSLPLQYGSQWLGLFAFLGGLSAAMGMIMIAAVTISTMAVNHLMLPLVGESRASSSIRRHLLQFRWLAVTVVIISGYWFAEKVGGSYTLVNIGMISFAAVLQFAPVILGGIFWKGGNRKGAILGLGSGFFVWAYTILIPSFVRSGWLPDTLLTKGPWGLGFLSPVHLFGISRLDSLSHGVLWSMIFNAGLYILGSLYFKQEDEERRIAEDFVDILSAGSAVAGKAKDVPHIDLAEKKVIVAELLGRYFPPEEALNVTEKCLFETELNDKETISILELAELNTVVEKYLTGSIGAPEAHKVLKQSSIFSADEAQELQKAYADIIANLKLAPEDLKAKIDYYQEREVLITSHAQELEGKIRELEENIFQRKRAEEALKVIQNELERRVEERTVDLVKANEALRVEITERKRAEGSVKEEKNKAQSYFDIAAVIMIVMNVDETVGLINEKGRQVLGYGEEEIKGKNWFDNFIPGAEREQVRSFFRESVRTGDIDDYHENAVLAKGGEVKLVGWHNTVLRDSQGRVVSIMSSGEDITERKRAESELKAAYEQLKQTQSQLLQSSKMAAIGQLASGVAHEINNPLTGVLNNVQLIKMEMQDGKLSPEEFGDLLAVVEESALRCKNIIRSLLDFSRTSAGLFQLISVNDVIHKVVTLIAYEMKLQNVNIVSELAPDLPQIMGDLQLIQQVIFNLLSNAKWAIQKKSGKGGGAITIRTSFSLQDNSVRIEISDTGIGISAKNLEHIFEPFFTTKPVGEGTGLGLAFVYNIIKDHKGTIELKSVEGEGTTFILGIPSLMKLT